MTTYLEGAGEVQRRAADALQQDVVGGQVRVQQPLQRKWCSYKTDGGVLIGL